MGEQSKLITLSNGCQLRPLVVKDPSVIELIEAIAAEPPQRQSDAAELLSWLLWAALCALPLVCLYLLGLFIGSGR